VKKEQSILPVKLVGLMLIDEPWAPSGSIPTRLVVTKNGIELRRGWQNDRQKIIARLKSAIANLEAEQEAATHVLH
jgi:hypothetical protein